MLLVGSLVTACESNPSVDDRSHQTSGGGGGNTSSGGGSTGGPDTVAYGLESRPINSTCRAPDRPPVTTDVDVIRVYAGLSDFMVTSLEQAPQDSSRWFMATKDGYIYTFPNQENVNAASKNLLLDLTDRVVSDDEGGLLDFAFHPDFVHNGELYVAYTAAGQNGSALTSRISRFVSSDGGLTFRRSSEEILLTLPQPYTNHNGGGLAFGPDGYLYIGFGDGGSGGDPHEYGQNVNVLYAKLLRIDVDSSDAAHGRAYAIPVDNPFAGGGGKPEVFAWGLRNPWRFSFDRGTGDLWAADVGQNLYEEINLITRGSNYGWSIREGMHCYGGGSCNTAGLTEPIYEYNHSDGDRSIIGGYVYNGSAIPELVGQYIFGDYVSGRVWSLSRNLQGVWQRRLLAETGLSIVGFAEDVSGEIYVINLWGGIHKIIRSGAPPVNHFPQTLSATGCFDGGNLKQFASGVISFDVNMPLWSDGAAKTRGMALPDGTKIKVESNGDMTFPIGTVLIKNFDINGTRIETRLLVRHSDGDWAGYSYEWNAEQTEAVLLLTSKSKIVAGQTWDFPSGAQCLSCHTVAAGRSLGPEIAQLNGSFDYALGRANQLSTLEHIGMFSAPLSAPPSALPRLPTLYDNSNSALQARAYLHANCSYCHRPTGPGRGPANFLYSVSDHDMGVCNVAPTAGDLGIHNARLLAPGAVSRSIIAVRMNTLGSDRMPQLGTRVVDAQGVNLVQNWISSLTHCP